MLAAPPASGARCAAFRLRVFKPLTEAEVAEVCGWMMETRSFEPPWKVQNTRWTELSLPVIHVFKVAPLDSSSSLWVYFGPFMVDTLWG